MTETTDSQTETETTDPEDVFWLGISNAPSHTVVRGPYTNEQAAVEAISEFETFHVEPRIPQDDGSESCVAEDVMPTY